MKTEKWYEKACEIFDQEANNEIICANLDDGFLFANSAGTYALFIPGQVALSASCERNARKSHTLRLLHDMAFKSGELATEQRTGYFPDRKCKVRELRNGKEEVYVYEKLLRVFPKNAMYYISGPQSPVLVGIWENDRLHEIGMVMPMFSNEHFKGEMVKAKHR